MKKTLGTIALVLVIVIVLGYIGVTVYGNLRDTKAATSIPGITLPDASKAAYTVTIENTGNTMLTNKYDQSGSLAGKRVFTLHGYWQLVGQATTYRPEDLILDEKIFGTITVRRR